MNTVLQRALVAAGASLGLGLLFDYLFYNKVPGVSFPLYIAVLLAGILTTAHFYKLRLSFQAKLLLVPIAFFSLMVFVRANGFVTFLNVVTSLYLLGLLLYAVFAPKLRMYTSAQYAAPVTAMPRRVLTGFKEATAEVVASKQMVAKHPALPQVLRGIAITIPILLLFGLLLSSADLVFRKYLTDIFSFNIDDDLVAQTIIVLVVSGACLGVFGYLTHNRKPGQKEGTAEKPGVLQRLFGERGNVEATILLASIGALFLVFLLIQLTYLFGGSQNITEQGFSYAEYARKGFFELIFVAALTYLLVLASERVMLRNRERHSTAFKVLSSVLVVEVMVMMASAFKRLSLYESAYGFTTLRVLSHIFTVWLVLVFGVLLYKILVNHKENTFAFLSFLSVMALLVFINAFNIDAFTARKNIGRYYDTGKLDAYYLTHLSDDATPEVVKLLGNPGKYKTDLDYALKSKRSDLKDIDYWQSANLSRDKALRAIEKNLD